MSKIKVKDRPSIQDNEGQSKLRRELSRVLSGRGTPKSRGSSANNSNYHTSRKSVMLKPKKPIFFDHDKQQILEEYADSLMTGNVTKGRNRVLSGNAKENPSLFYNSKNNNKSVMKSGNGKRNVFNTNNLLTEDHSLERNRRSYTNIHISNDDSIGKSF